MDIQDRLFAILKEKKITQKELSKRTGIPESTISDWKRKGKTPGADKIQAVCKVLGISSNEILGNSVLDGMQTDVDEHNLMDCYRAMNESDRKKLLAYAMKLGK